MRIEVKVPQLPESVSEATLVSWHKKAGDAVARDENLIDVETDKVVLELPAPGAGVLVEVVKPDGSTVTSNEVIAVIDTEAKGAVPAPKEAATAAAAAPAPKAAAAAPAASATALPAARKIMTEQGVGDDPRRLRIDTPIGSGPFRFGRYRRDTELQLVANKKHFSRPAVDEIWVVVAPSLDGLMGRLESQQIDVIESSDISLTPSQAAQLGKQKHVRIERSKDINWFHGVVRASWLPWRDYQFRLAWQHSIDREFLVKVPWEGSGRVPASNTFLVEGNPWHNPDLPRPPGFDLAKAREILKAAGYSWASDGRLTYPSSKDEAWRGRVTRVTKDGYTWGGLRMLASS